MANVKLSAITASAANLASGDGIVGYQAIGTSDVLFSRAQLGAGITGVSLTAGVTGILPVANGGTNASSASVTAFNNITGYTAGGATGTTSTNLVFSTSPTLVTPALGVATATSLAVGGATLGANAVAVTGSSQFNGNVFFFGGTPNTGTGSVIVSNANGASNKQLWFGDADNVGSNTNFLLRLITAGGVPSLSSIRGDVGGSGPVLFGLGIGLSSSFGTTGPFLTGPSGAKIQLGLADAAAPVAQILGVQSVVAGTTNTSGQTATLIGSLATGSGTSGDWVIKTGGSGAGATAQNTATTALTVKGVTQRVIAATTIATGGYTVATLPAGVIGDCAYVTDALTPTFLGILTGGSSTVTPVFYNGSAWVAN